MELPDRTYVERARAGDAAAQEALVRRHLRAAYAVALAVTQSPSDAEDLAQETLMRALDKLHSCKDPERLGPWVCSIARNLSLNVRASRRPIDAPIEDAVGPGGASVRLKERLLEALSTL